MSENVYGMEFLINRMYDELDEIKKSRTKLVLAKPKVNRSNRKTVITNFRSICIKLNRREVDVQSFYEKELQKKTSIDQNGILLISGNFKDCGIQNVLMCYIKNYVLCTECSSNNTELIKENRILQLNCKSCKSKKAINYK
jgi:translation initiation factor 2 subunit 2